MIAKAIGMGLIIALIVTFGGTVATAGIFAFIAPFGFIPLWGLCSYFAYRQIKNEEAKNKKEGK